MNINDRDVRCPNCGNTDLMSLGIITELVNEGPRTVGQRMVGNNCMRCGRKWSTDGLPIDPQERLEYHCRKIHQGPFLKTSAGSARCNHCGASCGDREMMAVYHATNGQILWAK